MKIKNKLMSAVIAASVFMGFSNLSIAGDSAEGQAAAADSVKANLLNAINAQNIEVLVRLITDNAVMLGAGVTDDELQGCDRGVMGDCQSVFQKVLKNLTKLLTPDFRMANSIHLLRADKLRFSVNVAQRISSVLLKSR